MARKFQLRACGRRNALGLWQGKQRTGGNVDRLQRVPCLLFPIHTQCLMVVARAPPRGIRLRPSIPRAGAPPFLPCGPVALCAPRQALGVRPSATRHIVESIVTSSSRATLSRAPHDSLTCFPSVRFPYPWGRLVAPTLGPRLSASPQHVRRWALTRVALARKGCFPKEAAGLLSERGT